MKIRKGTGASLPVIGRLKEVPEVRKTKSDKLVANVTLAVDLVRNTDGESSECTEWFNIAVWGQAAQFLKEKAHAGMRLYIEASVKHEKKEIVDEGGKKYVFSIPKFNANEVQPMDAIRSETEKE
jgi:single stranded DNA-binding protein